MADTKVADELLDDIDVSDGDLKSIAALAGEQLKLEGELDALGDKLKAKKAELFKVQNVLLPDAMQAAEMKKFIMTNGAAVELKSDMSVSVSVEKKPDVIEWLRANGHEAMVKNVLSIDFDKGNDNMVEALAAEAEKLGFVPVRREDFATGTLKSLLKEQLEAGALDKPLDFFGAYPYTKAVIKR